MFWFSRKLFADLYISCFWKVENFGMEVKDFEGAVKMQGAMMDKLAASRLFLRFRFQAAFKLFLKLKF